MFFYDEFLPSIFKDGRNDIWLTRRQTAVCTRYMQPGTQVYQNSVGDYSNHTYYICDWRGKSVRMEYSKRNQCGKIFYFSDFQSAQKSEPSISKEQKLKESEIRYGTHLYRNQKDKFFKILDSEKGSLEVAQEILEDCLKYNNKPEDISDARRLVKELQMKISAFEYVITQESLA